MTTYAEARDDMHQLFITAWEAAVALDSSLEEISIFFADMVRGIRYPSGDSVESPESGDKAYMRITTQHVGGGQSSLSGANGKIRWSRTGFVTVQIFTPPGKGLSLNDELARIVSEAFEGQVTPDQCVWFRNVRVNELGQNGAWYQSNVLADFDYASIR